MSAADLTEGQIFMPKAGANVLPVMIGRAVVLAEEFDDGAWGCDVIDHEYPLYPLAWIEIDPSQIEHDFERIEKEEDGHG